MFSCEVSFRIHQWILNATLWDDWSKVTYTQVHGSPLHKTLSFKNFNWVFATRLAVVIQFWQDPKCRRPRTFKLTHTDVCIYIYVYIYICIYMYIYKGKNNNYWIYYSKVHVITILRNHYISYLAEDRNNVKLGVINLVVVPYQCNCSILNIEHFS